MSNGGAAGGAAAGAAGAAAAAAIANAIKASGAIIQVEPRDFGVVLGKADSPLVVQACGGFFSTKYKYLTSYKGLVFYTKTEAPLPLPRGAEIVEARKIWVPS